MIKRILITSCLFIFTTIAWANVIASVDRDTIVLGQSITLMINLDNTNTLPNLDILNTNFQILGSGRSSETSIINGHISSKVILSVVLLPKHAGRQIIPAIAVGNIRTNPIGITILSNQVNNQIISNANALDAFVIASTNSTTTYVNEPVVYGIKIYLGTQVSNLNLVPLNIPTIHMQQLGKLLQYSEIRNGHTYQVLEQKFLLTPTISGSTVIPPAIINGLSVNNPQAGFSGPQHIQIQSKALTLVVKPIPPNVSQVTWFPARTISVSDTWSNTSNTIMLDQPVTRTIILQAVGVPSTTIPSMIFINPAGANMYPDKTQMTDDYVNNDLLSSKIYKVAYIPSQLGILQIPSITFTWWDIAKNKLNTYTIPAKTFKVISGITKLNSTTNTGTQTLLSHSNPSSSKVVPPLVRNWFWLYATIIFALLWLFTLLLMVKLYRAKKTNTASKVAIPITTLKLALDNINQACSAGNVQHLNQALLVWSGVYLHMQIYTISELKHILNNIELNSLLDQINLALYKDQPYTEFDKIAMLIMNISKSKENIVSNGITTLKDFYPK